MKKLLIIISLAIVSTSIMAQDSDEIKTLFSKDARNGGYFGLDFGYGQLEDHNLVNTGVRASWILAHNLGIGLAANGFFTDFTYNKPKEEYHNIQGGSAGFIIEPIVGARLPVHLSVPLYFGVGGAAFTTSYKDYYSDPINDNYDENSVMYYDDFDMYLTFKPGVEIELNLLRFFRLGIGGYYTFTTDIELAGLDKDGLNGWQAGVSLKFGRF
jgi:hypothetical protein